ncbi:tRNA (adenosine(37)-N6)-dimethylallyltransferase MiaA, partial [Rickettsiales bacterium]|nr:tRNA (adenosine(37)-N6)-dimethylallyltransferase MiaA [Rickettsiales bacterium]
MIESALIIAGPTASGKTDLAFDIARLIPSVLINADSMQVYRNLSILTNMPTDNELNSFSCKLFGALKAPNSSDIGWWLRKAKDEISKAQAKNILPIIVGGTGMYLNGLEKDISYIPKIKEKVRQKIKQIHALKGNSFLFEKLKNFDLTLAKKINPNDTQRILRAIEVKISTGKNLSYWHDKQIEKETKTNVEYMYVVLDKDRKSLYESIDNRFVMMIKKGVIEEVRNFLDEQIPLSHPINKTIGLKHLKDYINGSMKIDKAINLSQKDSRNYAKRQITWFKNQ